MSGCGSAPIISSCVTSIFARSELVHFASSPCRIPRTWCGLFFSVLAAWLARFCCLALLFKVCDARTLEEECRDAKHFEPDGREPEK